MIICMTEDFWAATHFSVVRYTGGMKFEGYTYTIVNKEGMTIYECSAKAEREGRQKAIEPGEPCDLCRNDFIPLYKKLGRDNFLKVLKDNPGASEKKLKQIMKAWKQK